MNPFNYVLTAIISGFAKLLASSTFLGGLASAIAWKYGLPVEIVMTFLGAFGLKEAAGKLAAAKMPVADVGELLKKVVSSADDAPILPRPGSR